MINPYLDFLVVDTGKEHRFFYQGQWYVGYVKFYGNGLQSVEVYLESSPDQDVSEEVTEYAGDLFFEFGLY